MIYIKKGSTILKVSKGAYKDTFKKLGYIIIDNSEEVVTKTTSSVKIEDKKLIEEEKNNDNKKEDVIKSENLNVNVIGENINNFDYKKEEQKEDSILEKVLQEKSKSKRK